MESRGTGEQSGIFASPRYFPLPKDDPLYPGLRAANVEDFDTAIAVIKKVAKQDFRRGAVPLLLSRLYWAQEKPSVAGRWRNQVLRNKNEVEPSYYVEALFWKDDDFTAFEEMNEAFDEGKASAHLYFLEAFFQHQDGEGELVRETLEQCLEMPPQLGLDPTIVAFIDSLSICEAESDDMFGMLFAVEALVDGESPEAAFHERFRMNFHHLLEASETGDPGEIIEACEKEIVDLEDMSPYWEDSDDWAEDSVKELHDFLRGVLSRNQVRDVVRAYRREQLVRYTEYMYVAIQAIVHSFMFRDKDPARAIAALERSPARLLLDLPYKYFRPLSDLYGVGMLIRNRMTPGNFVVRKALWRVVKRAIAVFNQHFLLDVHHDILMDMLEGNLDKGNVRGA